MKTIQIKRLELKYFKGVEQKTIDFYNSLNNLVARTAVISGANGTGKSTMADAFHWVLFGKSADDRKQFSIKTLDKAGNVIAGVEHSVTAVLLVDGAEVTLKREYREKWGKRRGEAEEVFMGHEEVLTYCDVPVTKSEYDAKVAEICQEDIFRYITNPLFFTAQKSDKQREMLFAMAGEVSNEEVAATDANFATVIQALLGKSTEAYKKQLAAQRKEHKTAVEQFNGRFEEVMRSMPESEDVTALQARRAQLLQAMESIEAPTYTQEEVQAQQQRLKDLAHEKKSALQGLNDAMNADMQVENNIRYAEQQIAQCKQAYEEAKAAYLSIQQRAFEQEEIAPVCPTCGHVLSTEELLHRAHDLQALHNQQKAADLKAQCDKAKRANEEIARHKADIEVFLARKAELDAQVDRYESTLNALDEQMQAETAPKESAETQTAAAQRKEMLEQISAVDKALLLQEQRAQALQRTDELHEQTKAAGKMLIEVESKEMALQAFCFKKAELMQERVNGLFDGVRFKLFEQQVNGNIVETCTATIDGVPYADANQAARINAGLEIIEALSKRYGVQAPIFIDNDESINNPRKMQAQTIRLRVSEYDKLNTRLYFN